jgi:glycosyltransferase involved in cell wall biosynthesis
LGCTATSVTAATATLCLPTPVVVIGPELACKYAHSRRRLVAFVSLVPEATVASAREALARPYDHELQLLSVGRLDAEKNPLLLADALARLRALDSRWRLLVCGTGSMEAPLARRLGELGLEDHAELRGCPGGGRSDHLKSEGAVWRGRPGEPESRPSSQ